MHSAPKDGRNAKIVFFFKSLPLLYKLMYGAIDLLEFKKKETSIGPINLGTLLKADFHQDINTDVLIYLLP